MTVLESPSIHEGRTESGRQLPRFTLVGAQGAPVIVVLGGISATRHVIAGDKRPGWWAEIAGDGQSIDTSRYRVFGIDFMDGDVDDRGRPKRVVTTHDQAHTIARALRANGIVHVHAIVGSSYGGMVALAFAERYPARVGRLVVISGAHESHPMATALRTLQRRVVELGLETGRVADAMSVARGLAMTTYRSAAEFSERFSNVPVRSGADARFEVDTYLRARGDEFAATFRPERFLALSLSTDLHRVEPERITTPTTLVAAEGDSIVPRAQLEILSKRLAGPTTLTDLPSNVGHDAFLVEKERVSSILRSVLANESTSQLQ